jgi:predicted nucleic acid-binding protein
MIAVDTNVLILYSEDVPGFDDFEGVRVVNPFK